MIQPRGACPALLRADQTLRGAVAGRLDVRWQPRPHWRRLPTLRGLQARPCPLEDRGSAPPSSGGGRARETASKGPGPRSSPGHGPSTAPRGQHRGVLGSPPMGTRRDRGRRLMGPGEKRAALRGQQGCLQVPSHKDDGRLPPTPPPTPHRARGYLQVAPLGSTRCWVPFLGGHSRGDRIASLWNQRRPWIDSYWHQGGQRCPRAVSTGDRTLLEKSEMWQS